MKFYKIVIPILSVFIFAGCGQSYYTDVKDSAYTEGFVSQTDSINGAESIDFESEYANNKTAENETAEEHLSENRTQDKIVYTCSVHLETLEYEKSIDSIRKKADTASGFIQSENEQDHDYNWYYEGHQRENATRTAELSVRIPSEKYADFLNSLEEDGKVVSKSSNAENVSAEYHDMEAVIESLEIQEKRLLGMMKSAETIQDMVTVESRLTEVQTNLNRYQTSLASLQSDVDYSTINVSIQEVFEYSPEKHKETFFARIKDAFSESWKDIKNTIEGLLIFLIVTGPQIIIFTAAAGIILTIVFRTIGWFKKPGKYKKRKKEEKARKENE